MMKTEAFKKTVLDYYKEHYRPMPWREDTRPYYVFVSEVMLQQTQVDRVMIKFAEFIKAFPSLQDLADAQTKDVLKVWSGLGYNRRGLWLHDAAKTIVRDFDGEVPQEVESLVELKGVGPNTAAAIVVYAFNQPVVFVETNIRAVFIHHFFNDATDVSDNDILAKVEETLDHKNPREWYWALMDYGVHIKKSYKNPARKAKSYKKQSKFEGSKRQVRGAVLRVLLEHEALSVKNLIEKVASQRDDVDKILAGMVKDGIVVRDRGGKYTLP